ncbi:unnamed protein product [Knipowitschia caucasica]
MDIDLKNCTGARAIAAQINSPWPDRQHMCQARPVQTGANTHQACCVTRRGRGVLLAADKHRLCCSQLRVCERTGRADTKVTLSCELSSHVRSAFKERQISATDRIGDRS